MVARKAKNGTKSDIPGLDVGYVEVKSLFEVGAVPREEEFAKFISYVHYLHKLLGVEGDNEEYVPTLGSGFSVNNGVLSVSGGDPPWLLDMKNMLGANYVAWSDNCVVFFIIQDIPLTPYVIATGFVRGAFMFPVRTAKPEDFLIDTVPPIHSGIDQTVDSTFTCSSFRLWYLMSEVSIFPGKFFRLPIKNGSDQAYKLYNLEIKKFDEGS